MPFLFWVLVVLLFFWKKQQFPWKIKISINNLDYNFDSIINWSLVIISNKNIKINKIEVSIHINYKSMVHPKLVSSPFFYYNEMEINNTPVFLNKYKKFSKNFSIKISPTNEEEVKSWWSLISTPIIFKELRKKANILKRIKRKIYWPRTFISFNIHTNYRTYNINKYLKNFK